MRTTLAAVIAAALLVPSAASAAGKPGVSTGGATAVKFATATLNGRVNPNGIATTYYFQYGTSKAYGARTPDAAAGAGSSAVKAAASVAGLTPTTTYHYRLVATNSAGTTVGGDHSFKTARQPLGLALAATPNPVGLGVPTTLSGTLSGTGNSGRPVRLQQKLFPFTAGWANVGNVQLTNNRGVFAFPLLSVPMNAQYRVLLTDNTKVVSPIVTVSVQVRVSTRVTSQHVRRGGRVHFSGSVKPALANTPLAIQKLNSKHHWVTISGSITRPRSSSRVVYGKTIHIRRGGSYRIYIGASGGQFSPNVGRTIVIHTAR